MPKPSQNGLFFISSRLAFAIAVQVWGRFDPWLICSRERTPSELAPFANQIAKGYFLQQTCVRYRSASLGENKTGHSNLECPVSKNSALKDKAQGQNGLISGLFPSLINDLCRPPPVYYSRQPCWA